MRKPMTKNQRDRHLEWAASHTDNEGMRDDIAREMGVKRGSEADELLEFIIEGFVNKEVILNRFLAYMESVDSKVAEYVDNTGAWKDEWGQ